MGLVSVFSIMMLSFHLFIAAESQAVSVPLNIEAKVVNLYSNSSGYLSSPTFPVTFGFTSFSTVPSFGYGIANFFINNNISYMYFMSEAINITSKSAIIRVGIVNATKVGLFSISYIAIWDYAGIFVISKSYSNKTNLTSGGGSRYFQVYELYSAASNQIKAVYFLKGFYITSGYASELEIEVIIVSDVNYIVRINTTASCVVNNVNIDILFYYTDSVTNSGFVYGGDSTTFSSSNPNIGNYTGKITNYTTTVFILGLGGFYGFLFATNYTFGWKVLNVTGQEATLFMYKTNLQYAKYSYFQIGRIVPVVIPDNQTTPTSAANAASPQTNSYLGIIVGLIVGVGAISVGIVVFVKFFFKAAAFVVPQKNDFRALPAISF